MAWARGRLGAGDHAAFGHGDAGGGEHGLGPLLMHGKRRGEHAGMGVRDGKRLQHALDAAILAIAAVQSVEADIGPEFGKPRGDIAADIEPAHAIALAFECRGAGGAGAERDLAFRGQASHQHRDVNLHIRHGESPLCRLGIGWRACSSYRRKPVSSEIPNKPSAEGESTILVLDSGLRRKSR